MNTNPYGKKKEIVVSEYSMNDLREIITMIFNPTLALRGPKAKLIEKTYTDKLYGSSTCELTVSYLLGNSIVRGHIHGYKIHIETVDSVAIIYNERGEPGCGFHSSDADVMFHWFAKQVAESLE